MIDLKLATKGIHESSESKKKLEKEHKTEK